MVITIEIRRVWRRVCMFLGVLKTEKTLFLWLIKDQLNWYWARVTKLNSNEYMKIIVVSQLNCLNKGYFFFDRQHGINLWYMHEKKSESSRTNGTHFRDECISYILQWMYLPTETRHLATAVISVYSPIRYSQLLYTLTAILVTHKDSVQIPSSWNRYTNDTISSRFNVWYTQRARIQSIAYVQFDLIQFPNIIFE